MAHGVVVDGVLIKREKEKDQLRMGGGSWSINLDELKGDIKEIKYISERATYTIPYTEAVLHGFMRVLGGERKQVVPLKWWTITLNNTTVNGGA
jgi:hypothetical protein